MKPFLKWAGGKRQLMPLIREVIHDFLEEGQTYYEPFLGAGSVMFDLAWDNVVVNDLNAELINAYEVIRDEPVNLINELSRHQELHSSDYFYEIRNVDRNGIIETYNGVEKAARTIYLNRTCYNGLYRVNSRGQFNTPIGRYVNPLICDHENILEVSEYLNNNNIEILCTDFNRAIPNTNPGDIVYFDPPYDYEDGKGFTGYTSTQFNDFDLTRLKEVSDELINLGCRVIISNNATTKVLNLFNDEHYDIVYNVNYVDASRKINSKSSKRSTKVREVLIIGTLR